MMTDFAPRDPRLLNPINALADLLLATIDNDDAPDMLDAFRAIEPLLSHDNYIALANATELCATHYCDIEICDDDDLQCSMLQSR